VRELQEILDRLEHTASPERAVLATVVDVKGSGYRLAGARMLVDENGKSIGSISGGCLEADVLERAKSVLKTGQPTVVVYDSTKDESSVFGLHMGCRGIIRILLEQANNNHLFGFLKDAFVERKTTAIATLIARANATSLDLGDRFYWTDRLVNERNHNRVVEEILPALTRDINGSIIERRSRTKTYSTSAGEYEFFIEVIAPPPTVLIFGAGHDAVPVASFAKELGWVVNVIDRRSAYATPDRFPSADQVVVGHAQDLDDELFADQNAVSVIMTHHYESDRETVRRLINSDCRYIGILGPKQRTADILNDLCESGVTINKDVLDRIYAPVGLDIGAATPEGIALSIIAEIQAVLADREGGHLKHRSKPIYDR
jgi:xanthine/CO dehydrogenase XdhC/CoxF family maturation factor